MKNLNKILLSSALAVFMLLAPPVRAETSTNPLITVSFWKEVQQSKNGLAMVRAAIDAGWDVNEKANNFRGTALHHAALVGMNEGIPILLSKGANPNSVNHSGYTPLHFASTSAVTVNLGAKTASGGHATGDKFVNLEHLFGSDHDDWLTGDTGANVLSGGKGDDIIIGGGGADRLYGD